MLYPAVFIKVMKKYLKKYGSCAILTANPYGEK